MAGIWFVFTIALAWLLGSLAPLAAQTPAPTSLPVKAQPAPYKPVEVTLPTASEDASFNAFRQELAKIAKSRVYSDLAQLVVQRGFFWDRDFGSGFDPKKPGIENLAVAVSLEARNGAGWRTLAAFAAEATVARAPSRPGVMCSPGKPQFSEADLLRLLDVTKSDGSDWLYPRAKVTAVHAAPDHGSELIDTLGPHFVRVWRDQSAKPAEENPVWERVLTPKGQIGFAERNALASLEPGRLCYRRDITGRWHIAGFVGGGD
jgi:hypothetical protein